MFIECFKDMGFVDLMFLDGLQMVFQMFFMAFKKIKGDHGLSALVP